MARKARKQKLGGSFLSLQVHRIRTCPSRRLWRNSMVAPRPRLTAALLGLVLFALFISRATYVRASITCPAASVMARSSQSPHSAAIPTYILVATEPLKKDTLTALQLFSAASASRFCSTQKLVLTYPKGHPNSIRTSLKVSMYFLGGSAATNG